MKKKAPVKQYASRARSVSVLLRSEPHSLRTICFFHPDCTVGTGISPVQPFSRFADFTAGEEFHLALKQI